MIVPFQPRLDQTADALVLHEVRVGKAAQASLTALHCKALLQHLVSVRPGLLVLLRGRAMHGVSPATALSTSTCNGLWSMMHL